MTSPVPAPRGRLGAGCGRSFGQGLLTASGLTHAAALDRHVAAQRGAQ